MFHSNQEDSRFVQEGVDEGAARSHTARRCYLRRYPEALGCHPPTLTVPVLQLTSQDDKPWSCLGLNTQALFNVTRPRADRLSALDLKPQTTNTRSTAWNRRHLIRGCGFALPSAAAAPCAWRSDWDRWASSSDSHDVRIAGGSEGSQLPALIRCSSPAMQGFWWNYKSSLDNRKYCRHIFHMYFWYGTSCYVQFMAAPPHQGTRGRNRIAGRCLSYGPFSSWCDRWSSSSG